jgi:ABC-type branched-subunit amino acid transport system substrate-binding protein
MKLGRVTRRYVARPVIAFLILALAACGVLPGGTAPVVRFGLVAPFEGRHREIGYDLIYAARLAVRECNGRGGVGGYRVELVALDDGGSPELAMRAAESLAIDPAVVGVIGHWLDETTAAARPVYSEAGLPLIPVDENSDWDGDLPPGFATAYQAVAPLEQEPGAHAALAYEACNRLIEAIGRDIAGDGEPTRQGVAAELRALND